MEYDITKLAQKVKTMNLKELKSNLRQIISEKYKSDDRGQGWRQEVSELLQIKPNTLSGIVNQAHPSRISLEQLLHIVNTLELNINDVLASNKVILSTKGRYGKNDNIKWNKETKTQFIMEFKTKGAEYVAEKYNLTTRTATTYYITFSKKIKIL